MQVSVKVNKNKRIANAKQSKIPLTGAGRKIRVNVTRNEMCFMVFLNMLSIFVVVVQQVFFF
jgi:hypothetical protein